MAQSMCEIYQCQAYYAKCINIYLSKIETLMVSLDCNYDV